MEAVKRAGSVAYSSKEIAAAGESKLNSETRTFSITAEKEKMIMNCVETQSLQ
jgi:hypothetical protein